MKPLIGDYVNQSPDYTTDLLLEGVKSYPQALVALGEFRRVVQAILQEGVEKMLPTIALAMDTRLAPDEIKNEAWPDSFRTPFRGDWARLGVRIPRDRDGWTQYYYLEWDKGVVDIAASISLKDQTTATRIYAALQIAKPLLKIGLNKSDVSVWKELPLHEIDRIQELIREVIQEWCEAWRHAGGLTKQLQG
jgi:hypothetical protein